ncbi:hypothetical protein IWW38_003964, partial [Coemansia aciculifera]
MQQAREAGLLAGENCENCALDKPNDISRCNFPSTSIPFNCDTVIEHAAPSKPALRLMADELVKAISADMELRLSRAARGKVGSNDQLDTWAEEILHWTGFAVMPTKAYYILPCYKSFLLFVAHYVKAYVGQKAAAGLVDPEECRLILPIAKPDSEDSVYEEDEDDEIDEEEREMEAA